MAQSLSWFDANTADNRFLATTLETIRGNLAPRLFIVTEDINMQNKAGMAGIPFAKFMLKHWKRRMDSARSAR